MSGLGRTDVGELFARPAAPQRAAGLAGALAPRVPHPPAPAPAPLVVDQPPSKQPAPTNHDQTPPSPPPESSVVDITETAGGGAVPRSQQLVVVYILPEDADWVTQQRRETGRTNAQIVLTAIEASADRLADEFRPAPASTGRLFATLARSEGQAVGLRYVQLGLRRIAPEDRDVLAQLVADTQAGSLSALVRAALRIARSS